MHTSIQRIQQTFSQASTVLSIIAAIVFVVSYIQLVVANVWSLPEANFNLRGSKAARRFSRQYGANDPKKGKENVAPRSIWTRTCRLSSTGTQSWCSPT